MTGVNKEGRRGEEEGQGVRRRDGEWGRGGKREAGPREMGNKCIGEGVRVNKWSNKRKRGTIMILEELREESIRREQGGDRLSDGWGESRGKKETEGNEWWGQDDNADRKVEVFLSPSLLFSHFEILHHPLSSHCLTASFFPCLTHPDRQLFISPSFPSILLLPFSSLFWDGNFPIIYPLTIHGVITDYKTYARSQSWSHMLFRWLVQD